MQSLVPGVFLLPCIWKKLPVAGSVSIVSKDIRNPLSLPAHNKKAAAYQAGFHPPDTSKFLFIY